MEIRSITFFCNPAFPVNKLLLQKAGIFMRHAKAAFEKGGYVVQTVRLATPPFASYLTPNTYVTGAQTLMFEAHGEGFDYVSIGPAQADNLPAYATIPDILASTKDLFVSGQTTTQTHALVPSAVKACAEIIHAAAVITEDGFTNLRFAALANVEPYAPFFPAAYALEQTPAFSLALESADLAVAAFLSAETLLNARNALIQSIEDHAAKLEKIAEQLTTIYGFVFKGLDFCLAPFPSPEKSIGTALESLGLPEVGLQGTLAAAAFITDTLDQADYQRCGFNGLMLPVLEDAILAKRAAAGTLSINDLLMASAVCGTGLDVIPLPGDASVDEIYAILLDMSALALRLNKPLTGRLMPLPGKKAGDATHFDFAYFANSKVMPVKASALTGLLAREEAINIQSRYRKNLL